MKSTASEPGLNLLFHWSPLICTSILFRDRGIVMSQSLLFSQPVTSNLSNRCRLPQQYKGFDCYFGKHQINKIGIITFKFDCPGWIHPFASVSNVCKHFCAHNFFIIFLLCTSSSHPLKFGFDFTAL